MSPVGSHSVIFGMSPLTEDATIIGPRVPRVPHVRPHLGLFEVAGMATDREIGLRKDSIAVIAGDLGLPALLALRIPGIVDTAALARDRAVSMTGRQTFQCLDGLLEMCQRCKCWSWKKLIGRLHNIGPGLTIADPFSSNFILHVENAFRNRGLRVDVLVLGPRIPLGAAVHRQYVEGVLAVVRLSRPNQFSRKIPLQIFDRSAGPDHVRFSGVSHSVFP